LGDTVERDIRIVEAADLTFFESSTTNFSRNHQCFTRRSRRRSISAARSSSSSAISNIFAAITGSQVQAYRDREQPRCGAGADRRGRGAIRGFCKIDTFSNAIDRDRSRLMTFFEKAAA
jgi:hypothetical protein